MAFYDNTNKYFKDKARKEFSLRGSPTAPTWFDLQRTRYGKLTQSKSGQAPKEIMEYL